MMGTLSPSVTYSPTIKCSVCRHDIELAFLTEHNCSNQFEALGLPTQTLYQAPNNSLASLVPPDNSLRSRRQFGHKIDSSAANRHGSPYMGELTPASSINGSISSTLSNRSGLRSPRQPLYHPLPSPNLRRPPSPELTNLDCAFPPFPIAAAKGRAKSKRHHAPGGGESVSSSNSSHRPMGHSFPSRNTSINSTTSGLTFPGSRNISPQSLPQVSENTVLGTQDFRSADLNDKPVRAEQTTYDGIFSRMNESVQRDQMGYGHYTVENKANRSLYDQPPAGRRASNASVSSTYSDHNDENHTRDSQGWMHSQDPTPIDTSEPLPTETTYKPVPTPDSPSNTTSLHYSTRPILSPTRSRTTNQMSPPGTLSRNLTKLFGRRRSETASFRKDPPKPSRADEPLKHVQAATTKTSISDFESWNQPLPNAAECLAHSEETQSGSFANDASLARDVSLLALEGHAEVGESPQPVAAREELARNKIVPDLQLVDHDHQTLHNPPSTYTAIDNFEAAEKNFTHFSSDSASSYGSFDFTDRSGSSRSSPPLTARSGTNMSEVSCAELVLPQRLDSSPIPLLESPISLSSPVDTRFQARKRYSSIAVLDNGISPSIEALTKFAEEPEHGTASLDVQNTRLQPTKIVTKNKGTCRGCSNVILLSEKSVSSADGRLTGRYHKQCFVCHACKSSFATAEFYVHDDRPYCAYHYHEIENSLCATCNNGIEGLYMETADLSGKGKEKHHPGCLKCTTCRVQLNSDYFEYCGKVYCERDAFRVANVTRPHDTTPARPSPLVREYKSSGDGSFLMGTKFPERRTTRLIVGTPF